MSHIKRPKIKTAGTGKRVILVYGPPSSGVSTMLEVLKSASETPMVVVPFMGSYCYPHIEEALLHNDIVFLDVEGGMIDGEDIQELVDSGFMSAANGAVIRVDASPEDCLERGKEREGYVNADDLREWNDSIAPIEEAVHRHSIPYFMLANDELEESVGVLALRANIQK